MMVDYSLYSLIYLDAALILTVFDIMLTHYQFTLDKKFDIYDKRKELNLIPRLIIGNNPGPLKALFHATFNVCLIAGVYLWIFSHSEFEAFSFINMVIGILFVVNVIHVSNLAIYKRNRYNVKFWDYTRQRRDIIK